MDFLDLHKQVIKNDEMVTSIEIYQRSATSDYTVVTRVSKMNNNWKDLDVTPEYHFHTLYGDK